MRKNDKLPPDTNSPRLRRKCSHQTETGKSHDRTEKPLGKKRQINRESQFENERYSTPEAKSRTTKGPDHSSSNPKTTPIPQSTLSHHLAPQSHTEKSPEHPITGIASTPQPRRKLDQVKWQRTTRPRGERAPLGPLTPLLPRTSPQPHQARHLPRPPTPSLHRTLLPPTLLLRKLAHLRPRLLRRREKPKRKRRLDNLQCSYVGTATTKRSPDRR